MQRVNIPSLIHVGPTFRGQRFNPEEIIIHAHGEFIENGEKDYFALDWQDTIMKTSCHFYITPSGVVIESVPMTEIAWHAKGVNLSSIGIEFLVPGVHTYSTFLNTINNKDWVSPAQFKAGVELVQSIMNKTGICKMRRHSDQAPGRKQDPGEKFPWEELKKQVL